MHITLQEHNQILPISIALNLFVNLMIYVSPDLNAHIRLIGRKIASYVATSAVSNIDHVGQWSSKVQLRTAHQNQTCTLLCLELQDNVMIRR